MKKFIFAVALFAIALASCEKNEVVNGNVVTFGTDEKIATRETSFGLEYTFHAGDSCWLNGTKSPITPQNNGKSAKVFPDTYPCTMYFPACNVSGDGRFNIKKRYTNHLDALVAGCWMFCSASPMQLNSGMAFCRICAIHDGTLTNEAIVFDSVVFTANKHITGAAHMERNGVNFQAVIDTTASGADSITYVFNNTVKLSKKSGYQTVSGSEMFVTPGVYNNANFRIYFHDSKHAWVLRYGASYTISCGKSVRGIGGNLNTATLIH